MYREKVTGDVDFSEVYEKHFQDVYRFALALCRDRALAEELTQDTFVKALESFGSFRGTCKVTTWLCQIARNGYLDHLEKMNRLAPEDERETADGEDFTIRVVDREDTAAIHRYLHTLPEPYREVFTLRIFAELPFSQISALFGKTESWSRVTFYRAKQQIISRLKEES